MKTRNKKRLISLVLVFALVFLTGAAFAFAAGILDIVGTVNISAPGDMYVIWYDVNTVDADNATHTATIVDRDGPNDLERTAQRILWNIEFDGNADVDDMLPALASIQARARNVSLTQDAEISAARIRWIAADVIIDDDELVYSGADTFDPATFGLSVIITPGTFVGDLEARETSDPLTVRVEWDGTYPAGFFETEDGQPDLEPGDLVLAGTLVIEFDYAPAS